MRYMARVSLSLSLFACVCVCMCEHCKNVKSLVKSALKKKTTLCPFQLIHGDVLSQNITSNRILRRRSLAQPIGEIHVTTEMDFFTYRSDNTCFENNPEAQYLSYRLCPRCRWPGSLLAKFCKYLTELSPFSDMHCKPMKPYQQNIRRTIWARIIIFGTQTVSTV